MLVEERVVDEVVRVIAALPTIENESTQVSWFAARQPAIVRFLASRCGEDTDGMAVALYYGCAIERAFHQSLGLPAPRVLGPLLVRAEAAFMNEAQARAHGGLGLAERQPALAQLVATVLTSPPVPLEEREAARVGLALAAVVYALDEVAFGRPVP